MSQHVKYISRACDLARAGLGATKTNPAVGAVLVEKERIIGEGLHRIFGGPHAEIEAMRNMVQISRHHSSLPTLYVSLEPCSHQGKTGACTDAIIEQNIPVIVIAEDDPNPLVSGTTHLREAGRKVIVKSSSKSKALLRPFVIQQLFRRPYIILKWAESRDGFIGKRGTQVQISNRASARLVHRWRSQVNAIFVGTGTVMTDNPELTTRYHFGRSPLRVTLDRLGNLDPLLHIFSNAAQTRVYTEKIRRDLPANVQQVQKPFNSALLPALMADLYTQQVGSIMVEGGLKLLQSLFALDLWDECRIIRSSSNLGSGLKAPLRPGRLTRSETLQDNEIEIIYRSGYQPTDESR